MSNTKMRWQPGNDGRYFFVQESFPTFDSAAYVVRSNPNGTYLKKQEIKCDDILVLPGSSTDNALKTIRKFWKSEEKFRLYGQLFKRGIMLYGPPGGGKSITINQAAKEVIDSGGIAIIADAHPGLVQEAIQMIREVEPNRPILLIFEDFDETLASFGEGGFLSLFDGQKQVDNVLFLVTTNHIEKFEERWVNRPGRIDELVKVDLPDKHVRRHFLEGRLKTETMEVLPREIDKLVDDTEGYTIAQLRGVIASVFCLDKPYTETLDSIRGYKKRRINPLPAMEKNANT